MSGAWSYSDSSWPGKAPTTYELSVAWSGEPYTAKVLDCTDGSELILVGRLPIAAGLTTADGALAGEIPGWVAEEGLPPLVGSLQIATRTLRFTFERVPVPTIISNLEAQPVPSAVDCSEPDLDFRTLVLDPERRIVTVFGLQDQGPAWAAFACDSSLFPIGLPSFGRVVPGP
jgi:hypothetical protein